MIELAASVWKVSPAVAVRRLIEGHACTVPESRSDVESINRYVEQHPQYRERINDFWKKSSQYLRNTHNGVLSFLRSKLRLESQLTPDRWEEGPGRLLGAYPRMEIERVFTPNSIVGGRCKASNKCFVGRKWSDVLVIPYHDMPGRICGFTFVGRNADACDIVHRVPSSVQAVVRGKTIAEGGLACFWAAQQTNNSFGQYVVGVGDPFLALRLQIRHFASARSPLPLVAYKDVVGHRTMRAWDGLDCKIPVLWGWRLTASLVYQAILCEGDLSLTELKDVSPSKIDHYVRDNEARDIMRIVVKRAKPWRVFLEEWGEENQAGAIEELAMGLESYGLTREFIGKLKPKFGEVCGTRARPKKIRFKNITLVEKDHKWLKQGDGNTYNPVCGDTIMNATLRIDCTEMLDNETVHYVGRLNFEGEEFPFSVSMEAVRKDPQKAFQAVLSRGKPGAVLVVAPQWRQRLLTAAMAFSGFC